MDYSNSEFEEEQVNHGEDTQFKHIVVTETPNSVSSLGNSEARQNELEEENRLLKKKNASMEKVINSNSGYFGKNKMRSKYDLTPQDQLNHRVAVLFMKGDMFPRIQILPGMWFLFSENMNKTICGKIMSMVTIPEEWDVKSYWNDVF